MNSKKIAVTGATGFLGRWTVERMLSRGSQVVALGRDLAKGRELLVLGADFRSMGLSEVAALTQAFEGVDTVVHCAGMSTPWGRREDFLATNVVGTRNVLTAARTVGVRGVVHISSPSIYMAAGGGDRKNISEEDALPREFINDYAWSKKLAEDEVDRFSAEGLPIVTLRPQAIVGPGDPSLFPRVIRLAKKGILPVIGSGMNQVDLTCVENVVDAIELAMSATSHPLGHTFGKKYNISNGEPVSLYEVMKDVIDRLGYKVKKLKLPFYPTYYAASSLERIYRSVLLRRIEGLEPVLTRYSVCVLAFSRTLNIEAARRDLGYQPRVSTRAGIENFVRYVRSVQES